MKKIVLLFTSIMLFGITGPSLVYSGDSSQARLGEDWYSEDLYRRVPEAEHKKHFPKGHQHKDGIIDDRNCYLNKDNGAYFCQFDWEE